MVAEYTKVKEMDIYIFDVKVFIMEKVSGMSGLYEKKEGLPVYKGQNSSAYFNLKDVKNFVLRRIEKHMGTKILSYEFREKNEVLRVQFDENCEHWQIVQNLIDRRLSCHYRGYSII